MDEGKRDRVFHAFDWSCHGIASEALADDDLDATQVIRGVETIFWAQELRAKSRESERLKVPFLCELLRGLSDRSQVVCVSRGQKRVITKAATEELGPFRLAMEK